MLNCWLVSSQVINIEDILRDQGEEPNHKSMLRLELYRQPLVLGLGVLRWGFRTRTVCHCASCWYAEMVLPG
jgi:hypothetical protein